MFAGFSDCWTLARGLIVKNHLLQACAFLDVWARPHLYSLLQVQGLVRAALRTLSLPETAGPLRFAGDGGDSDSRAMRRSAETPALVLDRLRAAGVEVERVERSCLDLLVALAVAQGLPFAMELIQHVVRRQNLGRVINFELLSRDTKEL